MLITKSGFVSFQVSPKRRNENGSKVDWRFTKDDARIKLKSLYPAIQN